MSYSIRRPREGDIPAFRKIASTYSNNPLVDRFETCAVVELNDSIRGFGVTRTLIEAVLYCVGNKRDKVASLNLLLEQAVDDARNLGSSQLYVFVEDNKSFEEVLKNKYGFRDARGSCLILEL